MKKLVLKKEVVSSLNDDQLARLKGGVNCDTYNQCPMTQRYDCGYTDTCAETTNCMQFDTYDQCPMTIRYDCGLPFPETVSPCQIAETVSPCPTPTPPSIIIP